MAISIIEAYNRVRGGAVAPEPDVGMAARQRRHRLPADPDEHLVEVSSPVRLRPLREGAGRSSVRTTPPPTKRLVGHLDAALGEQVDVAVAQGEAKIHTEGALDYIQWKAVAGISRLGHGRPLCWSPESCKART